MPESIWYRNSCGLGELYLRRDAGESRSTTLVTPAMFVIVACATGILLIAILLATSRDKGPALGLPRTLYASSGRGVNRPSSKGSSPEKVRPTIRQGLDI